MVGLRPTEGVVMGDWPIGRIVIYTDGRIRVVSAEVGGVRVSTILTGKEASGFVAERLEEAKADGVRILYRR
jgi:hypothetical protein